MLALRKLYQSAVFILIVVAGCTFEVPTQPGLTMRGAPRSLASTGRPTLFKNSVKYRDAGAKPATGRSGNATLVAQALLSSDGVATLSLTTGLEGEPPSGTLSQVHVKQFDVNGHPQRTLQYRTITGSTAEVRMPARPHGSSMQIQANIKGIDVNRTDVVTVMETVKYRPDLAVTAITHAPQSVQFAQTLIFSTFRELKGDVGAHADCVLAVDGEVVDQGLGIWIDAGREVSCNFVYRFPTPGTKQLKISLTNVDPGDYDVRNNSRTSTITITEPAPLEGPNDFTWDGRLDGVLNYTGTSRSNGWYQDLSTSERWDYDITSQDLGTSSIYMHIGGQTPRSLVGPLTMTFRDRVDGTVQHDDAFGESSDERTVYQAGFYRQECSIVHRLEELIGERGPFTAETALLHVCSTRYIEPFNVDLGTWFFYLPQNGDVTYYANNWQHYVSPDYERSYAFNGTIHSTFGTFAMGSEYGFELTFIGSDGRQLVASGVIPIQVEDVHEVTPYECFDYDDGVFSEHSCYGADATYRRLSGYAVGLPTTPSTN